MTSTPWHDLVLQLARLVPPIRRLHDHRNALIARLAAAEQALATRKSESKTSEADNAERSRIELERLKRERGYVIEFDYPYVPEVRSWDGMQGGNVYRHVIAAGDNRYRDHLASFLTYNNAFTAISHDEPSDERQPYWHNLWLPALDAICLSGLVTKLNPRLYVEVGSGNSTKFVRRAISDHGLRTRVISIDPHPRAVIDELCDEIIRDKLENCDLKIFAGLGSEDIVFIDNSHRSLQNSDVTVFFTEILPLLKSGCHYGIHDIFLPYDYPIQWLSRFYNEQYLLMSYLLGGANGDEIVLPVHYVERTPALLETLAPILGHPSLRGIMPLGGAFWMKRR